MMTPYTNEYYAVIAMTILAFVLGGLSYMAAEFFAVNWNLLKG